MSIDARTPVIVGVAQLNGRNGDNEPIEMMTDSARSALSGHNLVLDEVRVVRGIWPYADPGRLVAERLGIEVPTGLTELGGNEAFDLFNTTALEIASGELGAVLICSVETMRTRRRDKRAGRRSPYLREMDSAVPDRSFGSDIDYWEDADYRAWGLEAVNFYAMAASALRHRYGDTPEQYLQRTAQLWSAASGIAAENPSAWIQDAAAANHIAAPSDANRMIADPFPKLMTSNINVDQAAAVVLCSAQQAEAAGIDRSRWVFPLAGSGGYDPLIARTRPSFAESPSMRIAGNRALDRAGLSIGDVDLIDLYSCFPSAVQTAQHELGIHDGRPFTVTGGMTFAGGPFNSYCMLSLVRAVELLRSGAGRNAFLTGNGGWFTKHSFCVLSADIPAQPYAYERPQAEIDAEPLRPTMTAVPETVTIDAYTVTYNRSGEPERAIMVVSDSVEARAWATSEDPNLISRLISVDAVGESLSVSGELPVLMA